MAKAPTFKLNRKAISELLRSAEAQAVVTGVAQEIAAAAGPEAKVNEYTTDRAAASVYLPAHHQAADGALSRAAADAGVHISTNQSG